MKIILNFLLKVSMWMIPFIAKRICTVKQFEDDIDFSVQPQSPPTVDLCDECPGIRATVKFSNKSEYMDATFDRAIYSIRLVGKAHHSVIRNSHIIKKDIIPRKKELYMGIDHGFTLPELQTARRAVGDAVTCEMIVEINYYIESKLYQFWKRKEERVMVRIVNNPAAKNVG